MAVSDDSPMDTNKQDLFGFARNNLRWRDKLSRKATYAALDLPDDEMNNVGNKHGMGWKELAVIAGLLLGGGWLVRDQLTVNQTQTAPPPAASSPADSEYEVRFFDAAGNPIAVPHISTRDE